ncbi:MAG: outer membrane lipoprotein-sorting protein [bacterium]|nr:outer membrane lipoprotein-sorting protein [bacterium]
MKKSLVALMVIMLVSGFVLYAETLEEVLKKNYDVRGGLDKLNAIKTQKMEGKGTMGSQEFPITMVVKRPNLMKVELEIMGKRVVQAYDGEKPWWIMPMMGINEPTEMTGDQAKEVTEQAQSFFPLLDYKKDGHKLELMGKEDMEGTEVYKLKLTRKDTGRETLFFLDAESGITLKASSSRKDGENEIQGEALFSDYKEVDGMMLAHQIQNRTGGGNHSGGPGFTIVISSYKINEPVDDSIFKIPAKK